jgi:hypothetical protein
MAFEEVLVQHRIARLQGEQAMLQTVAHHEAAQRRMLEIGLELEACFTGLVAHPAARPERAAPRHAALA